jgi:hypothetical protein
MGLMKLATYYRDRGDDVRFFKGDLKDFAASLLLEEYLIEVNSSEQAKHSAKLFEFIRRGQHAPIQAIPDFIDSDSEFLLKLYRKRFTDENFPQFDVIGVTTLFTFYWKETVDTINYAKKFLKRDRKGNTIGVMHIGGIASSILPDKMFADTGIHPYVGLLDKPGAYDKDSSVIIDNLPLDYSILEEIDYKYPASNAYFAYMTRGCPNACPFCAVPRLEPNYTCYISLKPQLEKAESLYGAQKDLMLMDNNVFASDCFERIIDEIKECGFGKGATYIPSSDYDVAFNNINIKKNEHRNIRAYLKKMIEIYDRISEKLPEDQQGDFYIAREKAGLLYAVYASKKAIIGFDPIARPLFNKYFKRSKRARYIDFNQGVDARLVTEEKMKKLAEINIRPLRIAFDHYSMRNIYIEAIEIAARYGIKDLSNYLLYNYEDTPEELYERMKINVELCERLGVTIYSFPMKYHPIDDPEYFDNRDFIGKHWNRKFIRAIQAVLNSTKGKIGRGKTFFEEAFGRDIDEFRKILWMPEAFIIYRRKYDRELRERLSERYDINIADACDLTNEWWNKFNALTPEQLLMVKAIVSSNRFTLNETAVPDSTVQDVLQYYNIKRE